MAEPTSALPQTIVILYDQSGHILHVTGAHPPYTPENIKNLPAWHSLDTANAMVCQSAVMRCMESQEPQTFDVDVPPVGRWRTTFYPCRTGKVRIIGLTNHVPESVMRLTDRQREICKQLAAGLSSKEIARQLDLARETIDNHRAAIAKRIGIKPWSLVAWCGEHREWF